MSRLAPGLAFAVGFIVAAAEAQVVGTADFPRCYLLDTPPGWTDFTYTPPSLSYEGDWRLPEDGSMIPVLTINKDLYVFEPNSDHIPRSPVDAGELTAQEYLNAYYRYFRNIPETATGERIVLRDHIALFFAQLGQRHRDPPTGGQPPNAMPRWETPSGIYSNDAPVVVNLTGTGLAEPFIHPWSDTGTENLGTFVEAFINRFEVVADQTFDGNPAPAAYRPSDPRAILLNNEETGWQSGTNATLVLRALENDPRWGDPNHQVPPSSGKTMKQRWDEAAAVFGWPSMPSQLLPNNPSDPATMLSTLGYRRVGIFYQNLLQQDRDIRLKIGAYSPFRAAYPGIELGNYADTRLPGGPNYTTIQSPVPFSWHFRRSTEDTSFSPACHFRAVPTRSGDQAFIFSGLTGARPVPAYAGGPGESQTPVVGTWGINGSWSASGDFDMPVLYHANSNDHIAPDLYRPHSASCGQYGQGSTSLACGALWPPVSSGCFPSIMETPWEASFRLHRHWIKSLLAASNGDASRLFPWIGITGEPVGVGASALPPAMRSETIIQLCMLQSNGVGRIAVYGEHNGAANDGVRQQFDDFQECHDLVYGHALSAYVASPADMDGDGDTERLRRTLPDELGQPYAVNIASGQLGEFEHTEMIVEFEGFSEFPQNAASVVIRVFLETTLTDAGAPTTRNDVIGKVYAFDQVNQTWNLLDCGDYPFQSSGDAAYRAYGLWTPDRSTQRMFDFFVPNIANFVSDGELDLKFIQLGATPFESHYDLVQCVVFRADIPPAESMAPPEQGADIDSSGAVTTSDVAAFAQAFDSIQPAADVNGDGLHDSADVARFVEDFMSTQ